MTQRYEIPEKILKDYFILHDGIKDASAFYPLEVFNRETFDTESELGVFTKKSFHLYIGLCLGLFLSSLYFLVIVALKH